MPEAFGCQNKHVSELTDPEFGHLMSTGENVSNMQKQGPLTYASVVKTNIEHTDLEGQPISAANTAQEDSCIITVEDKATEESVKQLSNNKLESDSPGAISFTANHENPGKTSPGVVFAAKKLPMTKDVKDKENTLVKESCIDDISNCVPQSLTPHETEQAFLQWPQASFNVTPQSLASLESTYLNPEEPSVEEVKNHCFFRPSSVVHRTPPANLDRRPGSRAAQGYDAYQGRSQVPVCVVVGREKSSMALEKEREEQLDLLDMALSSTLEENQELKTKMAQVQNALNELENDKQESLKLQFLEKDHGPLTALNEQGKAKDTGKYKVPVCKWAGHVKKLMRSTVEIEGLLSRLKMSDRTIASLQGQIISLKDTLKSETKRATKAQLRASKLKNKLKEARASLRAKGCVSNSDEESQEDEVSYEPPSKKMKLTSWPENCVKENYGQQRAEENVICMGTSQLTKESQSEVIQNTISPPTAFCSHKTTQWEPARPREQGKLTPQHPYFSMVSSDFQNTVPWFSQEPHPTPSQKPPLYPDAQSHLFPGSKLGFKPQMPRRDPRFGTKDNVPDIVRKFRLDASSSRLISPPLEQSGHLKSSPPHLPLPPPTNQPTSPARFATWTRQTSPPPLTARQKSPPHLPLPFPYPLPYQHPGLSFNNSWTRSSKKVPCHRRRSPSNSKCPNGSIPSPFQSETKPLESWPNTNLKDGTDAFQLHCMNASCVAGSNRVSRLPSNKGVPLHGSHVQWAPNTVHDVCSLARQNQLPEPKGFAHAGATLSPWSPVLSKPQQETHCAPVDGKELFGGKIGASDKYKSVADTFFSASADLMNDMKSEIPENYPVLNHPFSACFPFPQTASDCSGNSSESSFQSDFLKGLLQKESQSNQEHKRKHHHSENVQRNKAHTPVVSNSERAIDAEHDAIVFSRKDRFDYFKNNRNHLKYPQKTGRAVSDGHCLSDSRNQQIVEEEVTTPTPSHFLCNSHDVDHCDRCSQVILSQDELQNYPYAFLAPSGLEEHLLQTHKNTQNQSNEFQAHRENARPHPCGSQNRDVFEKLLRYGDSVANHRSSSVPSFPFASDSQGLTCHACRMMFEHDINQRTIEDHLAFHQLCE